MQLSGSNFLVTGYRVIEADDSDQLTRLVIEYLEAGWTIAGPHSITTRGSADEYSIWSQTVIKLI